MGCIWCWKSHFRHIPAHEIARTLGPSSCISGLPECSMLLQDCDTILNSLNSFSDTGSESLLRQRKAKLQWGVWNACIQMSPKVQYTQEQLFDTCYVLNILSYSHYCISSLDSLSSLWQSGPINFPISISTFVPTPLTW